MARSVVVRKASPEQQVVAGAAAVYADPKTLVPWDKNPRINDAAVDAVARAIKEFGFTAPIVARSADGRVIAGHTRLKAALRLQLATVPVRFIDVTEEQANLLTIADNKLGERAAWDDALLVEHLQALQGSFDDLTIAGFDGDELGRFLAEAPEDLLPVTPAMESGAHARAQALLEDGGGPSGNPPRTTPGGAAAAEGDAAAGEAEVRAVQLLVDVDRHGMFVARCRALAEVYQTENLTETVLRAVDEAAVAAGVTAA